MPKTDPSGLALSGANEAAISGYEAALEALRLYRGDPLAMIGTTLADAPDFVMGHIMSAYLSLLGTEPAGIAAARQSLETAWRLGMNDSERGHMRAAAALAYGEMRDAARILEDIAIEHPYDILALQVGHQLDYFTGDARMLRDRIARALPAWRQDMPGYHALLGMHAFGLEENGDLASAERAGRQAVELCPADAWAQHAVAHVYETRGQPREGIAWMTANPEAWSRDNFFAVHNWWHVALYHLALGERDEALALFDQPIRGGRSGIVLELVDASALLWRLELMGIDAGSRWQAVADGWQAAGGGGLYAFNDAHAMMAFAACGRMAEAEALLQAQQEAMAGDGDNAMFTRDVGHSVTMAIHAFGRQEYAHAVRLLRPVRNIAHRFGGSHAQRDVFDLTLIEAARRSGDEGLATALLNERAAARPAAHLPLIRAA